MFVVTKCHKTVGTFQLLDLDFNIFVGRVINGKKNTCVRSVYSKAELKSLVLVFMNLTTIAHNQTDLLFYPTFLRFISNKCVLVKKATQYLLHIL